MRALATSLALTSTRYYTGIGSRAVPRDIYEIFVKIAAVLSQQGWILRSGGATGSDWAFQTGAEQGCLSGGKGAEIYLPYVGFNDLVPNGDLNPENNVVLIDTQTLPNYSQAQEMAWEVHPIGKRLKPKHLEMHARNMYQPMGLNLATPSAATLLWAPPTNTGVKGGTATAHELSRRREIPIHNFYYDEVVDRAIDRILNAA